MLDLRWSDEAVAVSDVAKRIGEDVVSPLARDAEAAGDVPERAWKAILDTGLLHAVPEERGGSGVSSALTHVLAVEGLSYGDAGIANAPQTVERIIRRCMQLLGPDGTSTDLLLEKWYRDVKIMDIFEGSGQVQRIVVARSLMGRVAG